MEERKVEIILLDDSNGEVTVTECDSCLNIITSRKHSVEKFNSKKDEFYQELIDKNIKYFFTDEYINLVLGLN